MGGFDSLTKQVGSLTIQVDTLAKQVDTLAKQVGSLNGRVDTLKEDVGSLNGRFDTLKAALEEHIDERTHDIETRLLRAFSDYNTSSGIRFRKLEADHSNLDTSSTMRLGELERVVTELQAKVILLEGRLSK